MSYVDIAFLAAWLGCLSDWLAQPGWLASCLAGWLAAWLAVWLPGCLAGCLVGCLVTLLAASDVP